MIKLNGVKIIGKSTEGAKCEVLFEITGDWIDPSKGRGAEFLFGPYSGFRADRGQHQIVRNVMFYKKYGTGWKLIEDSAWGQGNQK